MQVVCLPDAKRAAETSIYKCLRFCNSLFFPKVKAEKKRHVNLFQCLFYFFI